MAEILQIRLTVSQDFIGAGENTICVLEHNPVKIRSIKVGDTELTVYTIDENTITSGVYEIEYSGNNNFTSPILKESKTVKELLTSCEVNE